MNCILFINFLCYLGAHKIATAIGDPALELQVYVLLSELFSRLCDHEKRYLHLSSVVDFIRKKSKATNMYVYFDCSARYASKAYDLSRSLQLGDLNSRHHRAALLRMATALRKQGELGDAKGEMYFFNLLTIQSNFV